MLATDWALYHSTITNCLAQPPPPPPTLPPSLAHSSLLPLDAGTIPFAHQQTGFQGMRLFELINQTNQMHLLQQTQCIWLRICWHRLRLVNLWQQTCWCMMNHSRDNLHVKLCYSNLLSCSLCQLVEPVIECLCSSQRTSVHSAHIKDSSSVLHKQINMMLDQASAEELETF